MQQFLSISESPEQSYPQFEQKYFAEYRFADCFSVTCTGTEQDSREMPLSILVIGLVLSPDHKNTEKEITFLRVPEPCPAGHLQSLSATWRLSTSPSRENPSLTQLLTPAAVSSVVLMESVVLEVEGNERQLR